jgi:hypothetical protein
MTKRSTIVLLAFAFLALIPIWALVAHLIPFVRHFRLSHAARVMDVRISLCRKQNRGKDRHRSRQVKSGNATGFPLVADMGGLTGRGGRVRKKRVLSFRILIRRTTVKPRLNCALDATATC